MKSVAVLKDAAQRPLESAQTLRPSLTPDILNVHPGHDNSVAWLLWHSAREIDEQLAALTGADPVWLTHGFRERFGLKLADRDMGYGHSPAQARKVHVEDTDLLLEHLHAVVKSQQDYLDSLGDDDLDEIVDDQWDPPVTRGARLLSISLDALAHVAQAAYIVGMDRSSAHLRGGSQP